MKRQTASDLITLASIPLCMAAVAAILFALLEGWL